VVCCGQANLFEVGLGVPLYLKVNTASGTVANESILGATGVEIAVKINGSEENAIAFQQVIGITYDRIYFPPQEGTTLFSERLLANINPSVIISSKWPNLKYNIGFGALLNMGESVSTSTNSSATMGVFNSVDTIQSQLLGKSSTITPFISLGLVWEIKKHLRAQISAEQTLLNFYQPDTKITYQQGYYQYVTLPVSYRPLYFGIKLFYFF